MTRQWTALVAAVVVQAGFVGEAMAGPITWSYSSRGEEIDGGYFLTGQPLTIVRSEDGELSTILPYSNFGPRIGQIEERIGLASAYVTVTDQESDESTIISVPYYFFSMEGDIVHPSLFEFGPERVRLGNNNYLFTSAADYQGVNVQVSSATVQTPEPTSIVLACVGLAGAGAVRLRRRLASCSRSSSRLGGRLTGADCHNAQGCDGHPIQ